VLTLAGVRDNKRLISAASTGLKLENGVAAVERMTIAGADAVAVAVRILSIFD